MNSFNLPSRNKNNYLKKEEVCHQNGHEMDDIFHSFALRNNIIGECKRVSL